jgi:sugar phosphate isomerase/epimerase
MIISRRALLALLAVPRSGMKLSLSARIAESFSDKTKSTLTLDQLVSIARSNNFLALCMRASQGGIHTPKDRLQEMARTIRSAGLPVSMITGDFAVPSNNDEGPNCLRNIAPYLDLAETFGSSLIRICMKKQEDIAWAQRASDAARERNIRLAHQSHCASLFETVAGSLDVLRRVNRTNFGIIYEPANWLISGQDYGPDTIKKLQPWLFNVYVQNHLLRPEGKASVDTWTRGRVPLDHIGLWDKGGVNFEKVFEGLHALGYSGYVTVHQAFAEIMTPADAARRSHQYLRSFL